MIYADGVHTRTHTHIYIYTHGYIYTYVHMIYNIMYVDHYRSVFAMQPKQRGLKPRGWDFAVALGELLL